MEFTKENVQSLLKRYIQQYENGYEDYDSHVASVIEDIYADIFGIFPFQENVTNVNDEW